MPLYGVHQAKNAAVALAAVEAFAQVKLDDELVKTAFSKVKSPGRCEIVYKDPLVIIDASHNPHGVTAIAQTIDHEFDFEMVIAVVAVLADKDADGILARLANSVDYLVVTQNNSPRALPVDQLAKIATNYFKPEQIEVISDLAGALTFAIEKATLANQVSDGVTAVLVTGSVATAGTARTIIGKLGASS